MAVTRVATHPHARNFTQSALAILLLVASLLKLWFQSRYPQLPNRPRIDNPAIVYSAIALEGALGLALIADFWPGPAWCAAVTVFCLFALVSATEAIKGKDSCGCFGAVQVRPIYTMCLDLAAVGALIVTGRPNARGSGVGGRGWAEGGSGSGVVGGKKLRWAVAGGVAMAWLAAVVAMWLTRPTVAAATMTALGQDFGKPGELVVLEPKKWAGQRFGLRRSH